IVINLLSQGGSGTLRIKNDGSSLPDSDKNKSGMGMHTMNYRARMIGGSLKVESGTQGVSITCVFPMTAGKYGRKST
ncbi:MAG: hypothetical protein WBV69_20420, partial [Candidatus Sulfotelmatobacter sp.]